MLAGETIIPLRGPSFKRRDLQGLGKLLVHSLYNEKRDKGGVPKITKNWGGEQCPCKAKESSSLSQNKRVK